MRVLRAGGAAVAIGVTVLTGAVPAEALAPPAQWSAQVCTSLTDWSDELAGLSDEFDPPDGASPKTVKAALVEFLGEAVDATDALIDDMESAGTPAVDHGKAIAKVFVRGFTRARELILEAQQGARRLPTADRATFEARGRAVFRALDRGGNEVEGVFDAAKARYDVPELNRAFNNEPACERLSS